MSSPAAEPSGARVLRAALAGGRWARPFLVVGAPGGPADEGTDAFAAAVLCTGRGERGDRACDDCGGCHRRKRGLHPDSALLEPEKNRVGIGVDAVERILEWLALRPVEAGGRVVLVPGAERLTTQAQNSLLKTLEEPPPRTAILLRASAPRALLDTVRSRCVMVRFPPASPAALRARAAAAGASPADTDLLLHAAGDDAARLEAALAGDLAEGTRTLWAALAPAILASPDPLGGMDGAGRWLVGKGGDLEGRRERLRMALRALMHLHGARAAGRGGPPPAPGDGFEELPRGALASRLVALGEARERVERNVDPLAILEGLAVAMGDGDREAGFLPPRRGPR